MLKFKDSKKKFTIVYDTNDMTENRIIDGKVLSEEEKDLVYIGDLDRGDIFILDSDMDIEEWEEMGGVYEKEDFENVKKIWGMEKYFTFE